MRDFGKAMAIIGTAIGVAGLWGLLLWVTFGPAGFSLLAVPAVFYGWMVVAYLHYRQGRQEELLQALIGAAEAELPLSSALWAYLSDRPHGPMRETWTAFLLLFVVPGYYWVWHRRHSYDAKVERLAVSLESGCPLHIALEGVPGVVSRETLLAAMVGESTGQLAFCLDAIRSPARSRLSGLWLEILPRIVYPLCLLVLICVVLGFWLVYMVPKYQRIFRDFDIALPEPTEQLIKVSYGAEDYIWIVAVAGVSLLVVFVCLVLSATARWYFPVVSHYYQILLQSRMLQSLSMLLKTGKPAPEALSLLADTRCFLAPARRRLRTARLHVERGEALADSLYRGRVLPAAMVPLVNAAERAGNLPWAMTELAEHMAQRTTRRVRRLSLVLFPAPVVAIGVLVGMVAYAIFLPLMALLEKAGQ